MQIRKLSLSALKVGDRAKILGFKAGNVSYQQRLLSMGLVPKLEFTVVRVAPLGDPVEIKIRNFFLCLRKDEADILELEQLLPAMGTV